ncbi:MAG: ATP-binding cassette domain-containing protein [Treponema sp.]|jgi:energy-coupling factor transport system ATP-binding protein|nr:ATP-binding cassette domain-containing protein [Treponema sp.]
MISVKGLTFRYAGSNRDVLSKISLEIADGDFVGIIGHSGAGKSTLTFAINGVVPHHYSGDFYGSVTVNGLDTVDAGTENLSRIVGSVFQDIDAQMVAGVVEDELLFGLENFGVPHDEIETRVSEALSAAGIADLRHRPLNSLSGGQKQKTAIAAITALRPKVIVLDEPTGELDPCSSRRIFEYLKELNEQYGMTVIIVEQKIMLLCEFARRLLVLNHGVLLLEGTVKDVLQHAGALEESGVNIPRVTTLGKRLREQALYQGNLPLNLEEGLAMTRQALARAHAYAAP